MSATRPTRPRTKGRRRSEYGARTSTARPGANGRAYARPATEYDTPQETPKPDVMTLLIEQLRVLGEYLSYCLSAKTGRLGLATRRSIFRIMLAGVGFVVVSGFVLLASWFLLSGVAQGLSAATGGRTWLGQIACGVIGLLSIWFVLYRAGAAVSAPLPAEDEVSAEIGPPSPPNSTRTQVSLLVMAAGGVLLGIVRTIIDRWMAAGVARRRAPVRGSHGQR